MRSINTGNIFLIGHTDSKTTIIVTLNGVLLGLLSDTLQHWPPGLQYLFIPVIILLAATAFSGLVGIFPRTYRNRRYENSLTYHEVIVGKKPYATGWFFGLKDYGQEKAIIKLHLITFETG